MAILKPIPMEEKVSEFVLLRAFSIIRMNLMSLLRNNNQSLTSLSRQYGIVVHSAVLADLPRDLVLEYTKTLEKDLAYRVKQIVSRITFDSAYDTTLASVLMHLPIRQVDGVTRAVDPKGLLNDQIGIITEGANDLKVNKESVAHLLNSSIFSELTDRYVKEYDIMEAGDLSKMVVQNNKANPTYVELEIPYITGKGEVSYVKNVIHIEIVPRYVEAVDLAQLMVELDPGKLFKRYAKLSNKEISFTKEFLLDLDNLERLAKNNAKNPNNLLNVIRKENLKQKISSAYNYPFATMLLDQGFINMLKQEHMIDLDADRVRSRYMKEMGMMCIAAYDPTTDIISSMVDGDVNIKKVPYDTYIESASKYEREINQLIRLGNTR